MVIIETLCCLKNIFVHFLKKYFPSLNQLIFGPTEVCLYPRTIFIYFYGIFIGYMLWKYFLLQIPFIPNNVTILTVVIMTSFGTLCALSKTFRCLTSLSLISLCGKSGRSVLRTIVVAFLIAGPLNNILINSREVIKVFTCSSVLTYNMTRTRIDLMSKPFTNAMKELKEDIPKIVDDFSKIDDIIKPIEDEIEHDDSEEQFIRESCNVIGTPDSYNIRYKHKLEARCKKQIQVVVDQCKKSFDDTYLRCKASMPIVINYILCFPMKLDFFCEFTKMTGNVCSPSIDENLGSKYVEIKKMENELTGNMSNVKVNYTTMEVDDVQSLIAIKEVGQDVLKEFDERKEIIQKVLNFIEKLLVYVFLRVIYDAFSYHYNYSNHISFDNFYITTYYKTLDTRRKLRNQQTTLPLRKYEYRYIIDPSRSDKSLYEYKNLIGSALVTTMHIAVASCFIILNVLLTEILKIVREHAQIDYIQSGDHEVNITVNGEGVIADLIRKTLSKFNTNETVVTFLSNEACLPAPTVIPNRFYIEIYGTYLVILFLMLNEVYVHRLRWLVCASAYPKRQKYRILFLYNKILKDRRNFITVIKHKISSLHYDFDDTIKKDSYLNRLFGERKKCAICHEKISNNNSGNFIRCSCRVTYCLFCSHDIRKQCLRCGTAL